MYKLVLKNVKQLEDNTVFKWDWQKNKELFF